MLNKIVNTTSFFAFALVVASIFAAPLEARAKGKAAATGPKVSH